MEVITLLPLENAPGHLGTSSLGLRGFGSQGNSTENATSLGCSPHAVLGLNGRKSRGVTGVILLMDKILHLFLGRLSHYLQGFMYARWLAGFLSHQQYFSYGSNWIQGRPILRGSNLMTLCKCMVILRVKNPGFHITDPCENTGKQLLFFCGDEIQVMKKVNQII